MHGNKLQSASRQRNQSAWQVSALRLIIAVFAVLMLALGCSSSHRTNGLLGDGSELLEIRPYSGDLNRLLRNAHYLKLMGRLDLALKELEDAWHQQPQDPKVANELAQCYEELGQFERAEQVYVEALARHGDHAALHNNLCFSYYQAGQWDKAEACFRQVLDRHPDSVTARNNLGLLLCRLGRQEEAQTLWRAAEGELVAREKVQQVLAALGGQEPQTSGTHCAKEPPTEAAAIKTASLEKAQTPPPEPGDEASREKKEVRVAAAPANPKVGLKLCQATTAAPRKSPEPTDSSAPDTDQEDESETLTDQKQPEPPPSTPLTTPAEPTIKPARTRLTAKDLTDTNIEVLNGNGAVRLAAQTRSLLDSEGFSVTRIGNHRDWGAEKTTIYYRPEAEKVAQALRSQFFQQAQLQPYENLSPEVDIRLLLGQDLKDSQELLAKLSD